MCDFEKLFEPFLNDKKPVNISGKGSKIKNISFAKQLTMPIFEEYGLAHNKFDYIKAFNNLDDIGWAFFFMGDGSYSSTHDCSLELSSYSDEEVDTIKSIFEQRYNLNVSIHVDKRVKNGSGKSIHLRKKDGRWFLKKISKYILPTHRYKIKDIDGVDDFVGFPEVQYGLVKRKIYKKVPYESTNYSIGRHNVGAWDLEVEDNHNYFVSGCLVHNCVVKNQTKLNDPNNRQPFYLKIVNNSFKETQLKNHVKKVLDPQHVKEKQEADESAEQLVTKARVLKEIHKMIDEGILPEKLYPKDMGIIAKNLPKRIFDDVIKEESEYLDISNQYIGKAINNIAMKYAREIVTGE